MKCMEQSQSINQLDWQNPKLLHRGRCKTHSTFFPFPDERSARNGSRGSSTLYRQLNGHWQFQWIPEVRLSPEGFELPEYDASHWGTIPVPSNWGIEGFQNLLANRHL